VKKIKRLVQNNTAEGVMALSQASIASNIFSLQGFIFYLLGYQ